MARMVGRGALGVVTHNSDRGRRNRDDRRQWRSVRYLAKRAAKARDQRAWRAEAARDLSADD